MKGHAEKYIRKMGYAKNKRNNCYCFILCSGGTDNDGIVLNNSMLLCVNLMMKEGFTMLN